MYFPLYLLCCYHPVYPHPTSLTLHWTTYTNEKTGHCKWLKKKKTKHLLFSGWFGFFYTCQVARDSEHNNSHQMYNKHTQLNNRWGPSSPRGARSGCAGWGCFLFPPGKYRIWPKTPPRDSISKQTTDLAGNWEDSGFTLLWDTP